MQMPILDKDERVFREPAIFAADAKAVNLDNVLVALFMLLRNNGARIKLKVKRSLFHEIKTLKNHFQYLETKGDIVGYTGNEVAIESWLRSSLVNMVFRGKAKENVASLRPLHLESYRIRNQKHTKDYNTADQVFIMLHKRPEVMEMLRQYMSIGWDNSGRKIYDTAAHTLDVDTAGLLHLIKDVDIDTKTASSMATVQPILPKQADLFCDDVKHLLAYQNSMPRSVFIDYLRILVGFHLSLYFQKLVFFLPKMVEKGTTEIEDDYDWNEVVDLTDKLESKISGLACEDMDKVLNGLIDYVRASFKIKTVRRLNMSTSCSVSNALWLINNPTPELEADFRYNLNRIYNNYKREGDNEESEMNIQELKDYLAV